MPNHQGCINSSVGLATWADCLRQCLLAPGCRAAQTQQSSRAQTRCALFARYQELRDTPEHGSTVWRRRFPLWPVLHPALVRWAGGAHTLAW